MPNKEFEIKEAYEYFESNNPALTGKELKKNNYDNHKNNSDIIFY